MKHTKKNKCIQSYAYVIQHVCWLFQQQRNFQLKCHFGNLWHFVNAPAAVNDNDNQMLRKKQQSCCQLHIRISWHSHESTTNTTHKRSQLRIITQQTNFTIYDVSQMCACKMTRQKKKLKCKRHDKAQTLTWFQVALVSQRLDLMRRMNWNNNDEDDLAVDALWKIDE